MLKFKVMA